MEGYKIESPGENDIHRVLFLVGMGLIASSITGSRYFGCCCLL